MPGHDESDQLPEEGQGGQAPDDDGDSGARDEAEDQAGAADDDGDDQDGQGTGNPANAG